jgi:hypothetical protein
MKRLVRVVGSDGVVQEVAMKAEEAAFFMKLTEQEARIDPTITFHDVVAEWVERRRVNGEVTVNKKN